VVVVLLRSCLFYNWPLRLSSIYVKINKYLNCKYYTYYCHFINIIAIIKTTTAADLGLPLVPIITQINTDQILPNYFLQMYFNIILSSTQMSSNLYLPFSLFHQNFVCMLISSSLIWWFYMNDFIIHIFQSPVS
jgi:hypothetical protein